jgi:hypothetical protein
MADCKNWCIYMHYKFLYQVHEGTINVTLQTWDNVNASLNCQTI